jgi:hypothetical protein
MATGTVQGRLKVYVASDDTKFRVPGCWVKIAENLECTYTDSKGIYTITGNAGKRTIEFLWEIGFGRGHQLLKSIGVEIKAGETTRVPDVVLDPNAPGLTTEVKERLKQIIHDPPLWGYVTGPVWKASDHNILIIGATIWTDQNYSPTTSYSPGSYCFSRPAGTYIMYATHPEYNDWQGSVTIPGGGTKTKPIPMTHK